MDCSSPLTPSESISIGTTRNDPEYYKKARRVRRQTSISTKDNSEIIFCQSDAGVVHTRHHLGELAVLSELEMAQMEVKALRDELQKMREERDKWKSLNQVALSECYNSIDRNELNSELSFKTLQYLDPHAAMKRLEMHGQHIENCFTQDRFDLASTVQNIMVEIKYVKTNVKGDTLRWRLRSGLNLMQHISKSLQKALSFRQSASNIELLLSNPIYDERLTSVLKSADVQLYTVLNEIKEREQDKYFQEFREEFAPEYDIIHHEFGFNFYEKTKALMIHMYAQPSRLTRIFEDEIWENNWI